MTRVTFPVATEWFTDDRTDVRRMRASWHPDAGLVVLSLWQGDHCTGTFRMAIEDAPRLLHLMAGALRNQRAGANTLPEAGSSAG